MGQNPYLKFTAALRGDYADIDNRTLQNTTYPRKLNTPKLNTRFTSKLQKNILPALM